MTYCHHILTYCHYLILKGINVLFIIKNVMIEPTGSFAEFEKGKSQNLPKKESLSSKSGTPVLDNFSRDLIKYAGRRKIRPRSRERKRN